MKKGFYSLFAIGAIATIMFSCSKDPVPPVVELFAEVDADNPYTINFTTTVENVTSYAWEFGDGETSIEANPSHTYAMSGDYSAKVTVTGEGGSAMATKDVTIAASISEMLSGGPGAANGKSWKLSVTATPSVDGVGNKVKEPLTGADILFPATDNLLGMIGLEVEYDNVYTFKHDGSYSIDNKNGNVLAGWVYSAGVIGMENVVVTTPYGIFQVKHSAPASATWVLTEKTDLVIDAVNNYGTEAAPDIKEESITFADADYITFDGSGFIGLQDFTTKAVIREITADRMSISIFLHSIQPIPNKPSNIITFSFDAQ